jgi:hypothetical protein
LTWISYYRRRVGAQPAAQATQCGPPWRAAVRRR